MPSKRYTVVKKSTLTKLKKHYKRRSVRPTVNRRKRLATLGTTAIKLTKALVRNPNASRILQKIVLKGVRPQKISAKTQAMREKYKDQKHPETYANVTYNPKPDTKDIVKKLSKLNSNFGVDWDRRLKDAMQMAIESARLPLAIQNPENPVNPAENPRNPPLPVDYETHTEPQNPPPSNVRFVEDTEYDQNMQDLADIKKELEKTRTLSEVTQDFLIDPEVVKMRNELGRKATKHIWQAYRSMLLELYNGKYIPMANAQWGRIMDSNDQTGAKFGPKAQKQESI